MQALIDGDIVAYRCAAAHEADTIEIATWEVDQMMERILAGCGADGFLNFLSAPTNFRKTIDPSYKANRDTIVRPRFLDDLKEHLVADWKAHIVDGLEADDLLGIHQSENTVICSIDKDLRQVPGYHYNFVKDELTLVTGMEGLRNFYQQLLMGDRTDNIFGIAGIGKVKSQRIVASCITEQELFNEVRMYYDDDVRMLNNGRLLYILRKRDDDWTSHFERLCGLEPAQ